MGVIAGTGSTVRRCSPSTTGCARSSAPGTSVSTDSTTCSSSCTPRRTIPTTTSNRHGSATVALPSDTEILITRQFDAPASLVFKAFTTPELVKRWWGFDSSQWLVCDIDLRPGGNWRYLIKQGDMEVGFHGEYREIDEPTRIVSTEAFEGLAAMGIPTIRTPWPPSTR